MAAPDEGSRLQAVHETGLLDTAAEPAFTHITRLASRLFQAPIALVSLIDDERQWFKAEVGMGCSELPREHAFCAHAIQQEDTFVIPDATADPRFAGNPLVTGEPYIRFYAGVPVRGAQGHKLGTLCIIDTVARAPLTGEQDALLRELGHLTETQIRQRETQIASLSRLRAPDPGERQVDVEACADALIRVDGEGRVVTWNAAAETLFGWRAGDLAGAPLPFLDDAETGRDWRDVRQRAMAGETVRDMRARAPDAAGHRRPVRVAAGPAGHPGDPLSVVFTVAPMPASEVATGTALPQLRTFLQSTRDAIVTADASGRVTSWNEGARLLFGYEQADAVGRSLSELMPERHRAAHEAGMARVARTGHSRLAGQKLELEALHRDGTEIPVEVTLTSWERDAAMHFGAVLRDITHRRRAERERAATMAELQAEKDRAEAANQAKTRFLANVSHELRTPLNAIIGFAELLADPGLDELARANYRAYSRDILDSGRHLLSVINTLIDLSKAEAGVSELDLQPVDVPEIVRRVARMLHERAAYHGQVLTTEIAADSPHALCDETKLRQILVNLAGNALKFTAAGGRVTLRVNHDASAVTLAVVDDGPGMSGEDLSRAMEPFGKLPRGVEQAQEGTGLGLPLAKELTQRMGGGFTAHSAPGEGTRVELRLPLA